jgi:outer membrane protein OmpA-like peptidoglycan-associated protein
MKKILPWLLLLLLLILFCVWSKKDSIHLSSNTQAHTTVTQAISNEKHYIDYAITQKGKEYILSGNFTNTQQQNSFGDTCTASASNLLINGTTTNATLLGDEAIILTNKILPHFIANYSNGKIDYKDQILTIYGNVKGYKAKHEMQRLLNNSFIATQDNTNVLLVDPIDFTIVKKDKALQLSGTFKDKKQIRALAHHLRPTYSTINLKQNIHRIDKGAISLTEQILPSFLKNYNDGKIHYTHETLIVEGTVDTQESLDEMTQLLANAKIPVENLTILNPEILKRAQEAEALAKAKAAEAEALAKANAAEAEALAKAKAEEATKRAAEDAKRKAEADAKSKVQAEKEKARLDAAKAATQAKLAEEAAKAKITKLLQIENIEFEVAKGSLTQRGKATVDKLANILTQYPNIKAEIAGHTDSDGSAEFNQKLSQARVDTAKQRLISKGISAVRLTAKGYGESQPLVPNTSDVNKQRNRRVEINIQGE